MGAYGRLTSLASLMFLLLGCSGTLAHGGEGVTGTRAGESDEEITPSSWFLTPQEITAQRGGDPRAHVRPYTLSGNSVELLVDGKDVFASLYEDLQATRRGDFIWMTGWSINGAVMLDPENATTAEQSRISTVLLAAIERGVELRMLLNFNELGPVDAIEFCGPLNKKAKAIAKTETIVCAPDHRHNSDFGSLHQKSWVIRRSGETVAYVGSMDISAGRYDTRAHDQGPAWRSEPTFTQGYYGWTGGMLRLRGQVVADVARHLYDQITDPVPPFEIKGYDKYVFPSTPWPDLPIGDYHSPTQLQVLLTAGPLGGVEYGYYSNWAPRGETTILAATLKAISRAEKYIYLSDQFMWYPPIMDAIAERLPHVDAVLLLTDSGYSLDHFLEIDGHEIHDIELIREAKFYYQHKAWLRLEGNPKVSAYQMVKENLDATPPADNVKNIIYSHWKVLIVDDELAIIGTAGVEQAGMTNDLDMSIGISDPTLVKAFRRQLWSEHLNIAPDNPRLDDPLHAIGTLWPGTANEKGRVRKYWPEKLEYHWVYKEIFGMFEPCGFVEQSKCQHL